MVGQSMDSGMVNIWSGSIYWGWMDVRRSIFNWSWGVVGTDHWSDWCCQSRSDEETQNLLGCTRIKTRLIKSNAVLTRNNMVPGDWSVSHLELMIMGQKL